MEPSLGTPGRRTTKGIWKENLYSIDWKYNGFFSKKEFRLRRRSESLIFRRSFFWISRWQYGKLQGVE